MIIPNIQFQAK